LIASAVVAFQRIGLEAQQDTVELVYDYRSLELLADRMGVDVTDLLKELSSRGVETVAIAPRNLVDAAVYGVELPAHVSSYVVEHRDQLELLWDMPVEFPDEAFAAVASAGMKAVPRLSNPPWGMPESWRQYNPTLVILGAVESPGFPDRLGEYARLFAEMGIRVGVVEFAQQKGAPQLAPASQMVRVHGINQRELESLSADRIVSRYLRGVRERNIRVLYLRPFLEGENPWARSLAVLTSLTDQLHAGGYRLGESAPFPEWQVPLLVSVVIWLGIWAGAALLLGEWIKFPASVLWASAVLGTAATTALALKNLQLAQQGAAFLAAVAFPCLALKAKRGRSTLARFAAVSGVSIAGGLLVAGSLAGTQYLIKLAEFRGVKAAHVLPVAAAALSLVLQPVLPLASWRELRERVRAVWNLSVPLKLLIVGGTAAVCAGVVYILRTGNIGLPVAQLEVYLREFLEKALLVRPRTKEFLIGHPALYLWLKEEHRERAAWLTPIAVIGQLSMVNTFSHIHTPLLVTLARTGYGLLFGYIIGWMIYQLYQLGKGLWARDRGFRVSRL